MKVVKYRGKFNCLSKQVKRMHGLQRKIITAVILRLCFQVCALSIMTVCCAYQNEFLLYEREHYKLPECKHLKRRLLKHFGTLQNWIVKSCAKLSSLTFFFLLPNSLHGAEDASTSASLCRCLRCDETEACRHLFSSHLAFF